MKRGLSMDLLGPINVIGGDFIPFNQLLTTWAINQDYDIVYDPATKHFNIPYASTNDYYISWQIALKTANVSQYPIICLELSYNGTTRSDNLIIPARNQEIANSSLYHVSSVSSTDILSIGLKVIGDSSVTYTLHSDSTADISANIIILGL